MDTIERRRFRRIYFSREDEVVAKFIAGRGGRHAFSADVLNICVVGMAISLKNEYAAFFDVGDVVTMTEIKGRLPINFSGNVRYVVVWKETLPEVDRIGAGLALLEAPIQFTDIIGKLIYG